MGTNIEIHSQTIREEWETLEYVVLSEMSPSNPSPSYIANPEKDERERM